MPKSLEDCVSNLVKSNDMVKKYSDPKERRKHAYAICTASTQKSNVNDKTQIPFPYSFTQSFNDWYASSVPDINWEVGIESMIQDLMGKMNPRTNDYYTRDEAERISTLIKDRAFGYLRFNTIPNGDKSASAISSVVDYAGDYSPPNPIQEVEDGKTVWRYLFQVADDKMKGRDGKGELKGYTSHSHDLGAEKFIGRPLVINHDGDLEGGLIFDSWVDNGVMKQVFNVYNEKFKEMIDAGYRPSIKTIPTKFDGSNIDEYEALHTSLIFPTDTPGYDDAGMIQELESKVGETDLKEVKDMDKDTYTKDELDAAIKSSVGEVEKKFQSEIQELKLSTVKSSISAEFGTKDETLDKISGGGMEALEAFKSSIEELREKAKATVISQKSTKTDETEETSDDENDEKTDTVVSKIANTADAVVTEPELEITKDDKERFDGIMKRVGY